MAKHNNHDIPTEPKNYHKSQGAMHCFGVNLLVAYGTRLAPKLTLWQFLNSFGVSIGVLMMLIGLLK